jgi:Zinc knuckle
LQVLASPWHLSLPTHSPFSTSCKRRESARQHLSLCPRYSRDACVTQHCHPYISSAITTCLALLKHRSPSLAKDNSSWSLTFDMEQESVAQAPQEKKPNMSSLTRRACYKCGNVGHYAEMCSSTERLCYNCKQPGHESNGCPHPRTTESQ